jgi:hypothetical protein
MRNLARFLQSRLVRQRRSPATGDLRTRTRTDLVVLATTQTGPDDVAAGVCGAEKCPRG